MEIPLRYGTAKTTSQRRYSGLLADSPRCARWVTLKIIRAEMTRGCPKLSEESPKLSILQSLAKRCPAGLSSKYIIQLLDEFLHEGPNGTHQCLVFELLGPTLANISNLYHHRYSYKPEEPLEFEPETIVNLSMQILQGLDCLHEMGYANGGMPTPSSSPDTGALFKRNC